MMLHRPKPTKVRVEPTTSGARRFTDNNRRVPPFDQLHSTIATTNSAFHVTCRLVTMVSVKRQHQLEGEAKCLVINTFSAMRFVARRRIIFYGEFRRDHN